MNNQLIIEYVPIIKSVKVDVHNKPFRIPSLLKRKRVKPTDLERAYFFYDIIFDDISYKPSDFLE